MEVDCVMNAMRMCYAPALLVLTFGDIFTRVVTFSPAPLPALGVYRAGPCLRAPRHSPGLAPAGPRWRCTVMTSGTNSEKSHLIVTLYIAKEALTFSEFLPIEVDRTATPVLGAGQVVSSIRSATRPRLSL